MLERQTPITNPGGPAMNSSSVMEDGPHRIAVCLSPDAHERSKLENGFIAGLLEKARPGASQHARIEPLITSVEPAAVQDLVKRASALDPTYKPVDFGRWHLVHLASGETTGDSPPTQQPFSVKTPEDAANLVHRLHALDEVHSAHGLQSIPPPAVAAPSMSAVKPDDNPLSKQQGYLGPAPLGIDARYAWDFAGGAGAGVGFVDLEQGWDLNHEDLAAANISLISGTNNAFRDHGTGVLGEVLMVDNNLGGVGIAPQATGRVVSQFQPGGYNTTSAIISAANAMKFGDVLLLEAQDRDPVTGTGYWPVEIADAVFAAIRTATAAGIIVIEAAGNGSNNLDAYKSAAGLQIFNRSSKDFRDSGAIIVGAGSSIFPHTRLSFSNYGSRIDAFGWGENVETSSTDSTGTDNTAYTSAFSGTSSASPIIAGAALVVQGVFQAKNGPSARLAPFTMRQILSSNGTPTAQPASDLIGVMPNLRAIIDHNFPNNAPVDIWIRKFVGDFGNPITSTSASPDIIVRQQPVLNPQATFGANSGNGTSTTLSQNVLSGKPMYVYVRLLNRGGANATNVTVNVYFAPLSTLVTPQIWTLIGSLTISNIPTGNVLTVSPAALQWPIGNSPNHIPAAIPFCYAAVIGNAADPAPAITTTAQSFDQYVSTIDTTNNVAFSNLQLLSSPPPGPAGTFHTLPFVVAGAWDAPRVFALETFGSLPLGSQIELRIPQSLYSQLNVKLVTGNPNPADKPPSIGIPVPGNSSLRIGQGFLGKGTTASCTMRIQVPANTYYAPGTIEFGIRQLYNNSEVGRVTWHFGQPTAV